MASPGKVGLVGSGLVGKSWAMIFASVGYEVWLYDIHQEQLDKAVIDIGRDVDQFEKDGTLRGTLPAHQQKKLIHITTDLAECIKGCVYVQESVPENLDLKKSIWTAIDKLVDCDTMILASSTSCIVPSLISEGLKHRNQFIVAHPVNPPYHAPMTELVPAPWTNDHTRAEARTLMSRVGQVPVSLSRELPGFVLNRMQYALLNECWRLLANKVVSVEDLDVVMKDGLGLRYAFMGPMETIHLNAPKGVAQYCQSYGNTIYNVSQDLGPTPEDWKMETDEHKKQVEEITKELENLYPLEKLDERKLRRDTCLAALAKLKRSLPK
eukprot:maker-scaffold18_size714446-snap-gene-5.18 protein:Tk08489 transcript:maker-scaffold18_size714446-snap-gene-5.18-mRNA-1 annotation:"hypothetical protein DAPPUDRAFT_306692"